MLRLLKELVSSRALCCPAVFTWCGDAAQTPLLHHRRTIENTKVHNEFQCVQNAPFKGSKRHKRGKKERTEPHEPVFPHPQENRIMCSSRDGGWWGGERLFLAARLKGTLDGDGRRHKVKHGERWEITGRMERKCDGENLIFTVIFIGGGKD